MSQLLPSLSPADAQIPSVRYVTVEVFLNKGIRVSGDVGPVLTAQLNPNAGHGTVKTHSDEKGW